MFKPSLEFLILHMVSSDIWVLSFLSPDDSSQVAESWEYTLASSRNKYSHFCNLSTLQLAKTCLPATNEAIMLHVSQLAWWQLAFFMPFFVPWNRHAFYHTVKKQ